VSLPFDAKLYDSRQSNLAVVVESELVLDDRGIHQAREIIVDILSIEIGPVKASMNEEPRHGLIVSGQVIPMNELPVPISASIAWRANGLVFAIPVLLFYTTGVEITILVRIRDRSTNDEPSSVSREFGNVHDLQKRIARLKLNGAPVDLRGGQFFETGCNVSAWSAYSTHHDNPSSDDMRFDLDWPEFENASYTLTGLRREAMEAEILWPDRRP
jgi:hypothetical protein